MSDSMADVLIVGAGMSGLAAAGALIEYGLRVTVLDKGRSVGGRLATRRMAGGLADHGAQFFTARSLEFQRLVDAWLAEGLVYRWSSGFSSGSLAADSPDGHPRYATRGGMNALAKRMALAVEGLANVHVRVRVTRVEPTGGSWRAVDEAGTAYQGRALLLTAPVPQSLALLGQIVERLPKEQQTALERIVYAPCLAGLFLVEGGVRLPEPGALQRADADVSWMADNQRKGISPGARIITAHGGPDFSQRMWDAPDGEALASLQREVEAYLAPGAAITQGELKRWRYALPTALHPARCLLAGDVPTLAFAGDAFSEPRVEGAYLSGLAAAEAVIAALTGEEKR